MVFPSKLKRHHAKIEKRLPFLYADYGYQLIEGLETDSSLYFILGNGSMRLYVDYEFYDRKRTRLGFYVDDPRPGERPPVRLDIFDIAAYSDEQHDPAHYASQRQKIFKRKFEPALAAYAPPAARLLHRPTERRPKPGSSHPGQPAQAVLIQML